MYDLIRALLPYPSIDKNGNLSDGYAIKQPSTCKKCHSRECALFRDSIENPSHKICKYNLSVFLFNVDDETIVFNGLIEPIYNSKCPSGTKKRLKSQKVGFEEVQRFCNILSMQFAQIGAWVSVQRSKAVADATASFHGIKTVSNLVFRNIETYLFKDSGVVTNEQVEALPPVQM